MRQRLSRLTKLLYGSGDLGFSLTTTLIGAYLAIFLTDVVRISPALAGTVILISKVYDSITDPFEGILADRTRTKLGRRRPYLARTSSGTPDPRLAGFTGERCDRRGRWARALRTLHFLAACPVVRGRAAQRVRRSAQPRQRCVSSPRR